MKKYINADFLLIAILVLLCATLAVIFIALQFEGSQIASAAMVAVFVELTALVMVACAAMN